MAHPSTRIGDSSAAHPHHPCDVQIGEIGFVRIRPADADWRLATCTNQRYDILAWAISGKAHYEWGGDRVTVSRGQMLFFPQGTEHAAVSDANHPWSFCTIAFTMRDTGGDSGLADLGLPYRVQAENPVAITAMCQELEQLWIAKETGYLLRVRGIILSLLHAFVAGHVRSAQQRQHASRIRPIVQLLQSNFRRSYSVDELAEMAGLSASRFAVLFKRFTGQSAVRYQNWLRMNKARDLLLSGECSVGKAAEAVGFSDVYYFSRLFRQMMGQNASHYRNQ